MTGPNTARFRAARLAFEEVVELGAGERAARLAALAAADPELAAAVVALLGADERAGAFLEESAGAFAPEVVHDWLASSPEQGEVAGGEALGPYRTLSLLGRGGMGEVYLAERADGQFEQRVAIKLLKRGMDSEEILRRFLRERQILARLEHPSIARLLDGGMTPSGRPYLVMELADGEPITESCERRSLPLDERLRLLILCCEAVEAAHHNLVVHCDLKPSNILVSADGEVKLLDFGIAKLLATRADATLVTRSAERPLTPAYAAPEQILGEPVSTATDVYALGVVLYQLLTGLLPHDRDTTSPAELSSRVEGETITRPSSAVRRAATATSGQQGRKRPFLGVGRGGAEKLARRLAGDLDTIVLKSLQREPQRRYPSAAALADDLKRHLAGRPVKARPDTLLYRAGKFVRRHRVAVTSGALAAAALVAGLGLALWQGRLALAEARRADAQAQRAAGEAQRAERVKDFLVALFREASPLQRAGDRPLSAEDLLDRGIEKARAELAAEPALQAELLRDFSTILGNLGRAEAGLALAEESFALARRSTGEASALAADALGNVGTLQLLAGDYQRAAETAREALALTRAATGDDSLETAQQKAELVMALSHLGRNEEGLALEREVVASLARLRGESHPATVLNLQTLGAMLVATGRLPESEPVFRRSLAGLEALHGPEHMKVGIGCLNLGEVVARLGLRSEAVPLLERSLAVLGQRLGEEHHLYVTALQTLGVVESDARRFERADQLLRRAAAILAESGHFGLGSAQADVGANLLAAGRFAEAATELEAARETLRRAGRADTVGFWQAGAHLAYARFRLGATAAAAAESELRAAKQRLEALTDAISEERLPVELLLGEVLRGRGAAAEAAALHRHTLDLALRFYGPSHPTVAEARFQLGADLASQPGGGERAEATALLRQAAATFRALDPAHPRLAEIEACVDQGEVATDPSSRSQG